MIGWIIIFCCWVVSFVFAGIEAGLLSLDQVRLRHQVKLHNHSAILLDRLMKAPERLLATILLVTNFADIAGLLLLTRRMVALLGIVGYPVALLVAAPIYLFLLAFSHLPPFPSPPSFSLFPPLLCLLFFPLPPPPLSRRLITCRPTFRSAPRGQRRPPFVAAGPMPCRPPSATCRR